MKIVKSIIPAFLISGFLSFVIVATVYTRIEGTELNKDAFILDTKPTVIYDSEKNVMAKFYKDIRNTAMFDEIPVEIIDGVVSTEDRDFFSHAGISVKAISRALVEIVKANGQLVQGGSTITQQLIKNTHLTSTKSWERKQQEAILSTLLEQQYSKKEILEMYLNNNEYGNLAIGIKDATMTYFGVTFEEFNKLPREERIIKGSLLAGISQSPTRLNPYKNPDGAKKRRDEVIKNLYATGKISEAEYKNTIGKDLMILKSPNKYFKEQRFERQELVHYALYETSKKLNITIQEAMKSGYDIYTSFDTKVYDIIRKDFESGSLFPKSTDSKTKVEGASVYLNPKTGEIVAFTGGRKDEELAFLGYNRAFMMKKQPGSAIKPIISYGPALESGKFTPYSMLLDEAGHVFPGGYSPKNWDGKGRGQVTMKEALRQSWNIPAVWTLQQVGLSEALEYVKKLGLNLDNENSLGIALGGFTDGISPMELADSYQAFANKGIRTPAHAIRIVEANKKVLFEAKINKEQTIKAQNAADMKDMLRNNVSNGVASGASVSGRQIAGKTGTVAHPLLKGKPNSDIWFAGFDEELLGVVWMGYDQVTTSRYLNVSSSFAAKAWSKTTKKILNYQATKKKLTKPELLEVSKPPDDTSPIINLNGAKKINLILGETYKELGATAVDNLDGDITSKITIDGAVNSGTVGEYVITYKVTDSAGNQTIEKRNISVAKHEPKTYTLNATANENKGTISLSWTKGDEDTTFKIVRNGKTILETSNHTYEDNAVEKGVYYEYQVIIIDKKTGATSSQTAKKTVSLKIAEPPKDVVTEKPAKPTVEVTPPPQENLKPTPTDEIKVEVEVASPDENAQIDNQ